VYSNTQENLELKGILYYKLGLAPSKLAGEDNLWLPVNMTPGRPINLFNDEDRKNFNFKQQ